MNKPLRFILAVAVIVLSVSLLVWGFWPTERVTRTQPITPAEMTLPTPQSFLPDLWVVS